MDRHELEEKTKPQLIEMAAAIGMTLTPATSKGDMIDMLLGAPAPAEKPQEEGAMPKLGTLSTLDGSVHVGKKVKVMIMATDGDKSDVVLGINGHLIKIQRGVEVEIDEAYVGVLRDAVVKTVSRDPETGRVTPMTEMRLPYQASSL